MICSETRTNQRSNILSLLISAGGDWVPLPKITKCAAQYNARIFELRRLGFRIVNKTREVNGERHSWFRLEPVPADTKVEQTETIHGVTTNSFPQFGSLAPEGYGVD